jgi:carbamoyltransferase
VRDGEVIAAVTQERFTRRKHDGQHALSNRLPLLACLEAANVVLEDVDTITSSFQAVAPGGVGFHRPLIESDFSLFDPYDARHRVISHHLAHCLSAFGASTFSSAAVIVCDLAGSATFDGGDFDLTFRDFEALCRDGMSEPRAVKSENLSIYEMDRRSATLRHREYVVPHNNPENFICGTASLYDNVSRAIFRTENAHGQLMALASLKMPSEVTLSVADLLSVDSEGNLTFHNGWQSGIAISGNPLDYVVLAHAAQKAAECALTILAAKARAMTNQVNLAVAGGVFLNIVSNSAIAASGLFNDFFVPSAPHDAGISVGCAYAGQRRASALFPLAKYRPSDRLGRSYSAATVAAAVSGSEVALGEVSKVDPAQIAADIHNGKIVARFKGRSEFGPRALGGRSLLASPLRVEVKDRLNEIKGRQGWRPVAPIVQAERMGDFFEGPKDSPYMTHRHMIKPDYKGQLLALCHPDGSTRAQSLVRDEDAELHRILMELESASSFPIAVNTSLNGAGEPIVETPEDAIQFFLTHDVDFLQLEDLYIGRRAQAVATRFALAPGTMTTVVSVASELRFILARENASLEISRKAFDQLESTGEYSPILDVNSELAVATERGFLVGRAA